MSQYVVVAATMTIAQPRLRSYLRAPVAPASTWSEQDWAGVCDPWPRYRAELPSAIAECDRWIKGDYADLLRDFDELTLRHDDATDSLLLEFDTRADFQLPTLIWACCVLRGVTPFMADDDSGCATITTDWDDDAELRLRLSPNRSAFLDPDRDRAAIAKAKDADFDVRLAISDADPDESGADVLDRLT
ncbi:hypothetical protein V5P93_003137 [Actinokineospora auranticolor]|uniref:Uncharacterized protein n=1 Tax=Actinokineospora auranticolor TaxID=155976 RepID=A0A2S6H1A8_9PSEU|nr:hypothetical protein [Actinokineospora auranticolor]PPK71272.1 hypothetical protein CLV40_101461 [Actinokineospora auranticolor]